MQIFNFVDIFMGYTLARGYFVGKKSNLFIELFKLMGLLFATFIGAHYYVSLGITIKNYFDLKFSIQYLIAFNFLVFLVILIFYLIREGWIMILGINPKHPVVIKGGIVVSLIKSYFICGLIFLSFVTSGNEFLSKSAKESFSSQFVKETSISVYRGIFTGINYFLSEEKINNAVFAAVSSKPANQKQKEDNPPVASE